jgi:Secretion system C-terminal sorting domain
LFDLLLLKLKQSYLNGILRFLKHFEVKVLCKRFIALPSILLLCCSVGFSQSPGGVSSNLKLWLKANAGVTGTTNVSNWADQSGLGNNAFQATPANQPALVLNDLNFNPSINFYGSTSIMSLTSPPADLNSTIFAVGIPTVNTNWRTMFRGAVNDHPIIIQSGGTTLGFYDNSGGGLQSSGFTWLQNEPALVGLEMYAGNVNFRKNGTQGASISTINLAGVSLNYFGNYQGNGQNFGRITEAIIYNGASTLSATQKMQIESYLAVKYGLTLTNDYLASDGSTIWSSTTNATYANNITGIGRDDNSALDQRQSLGANATASVTLNLGGPFSSDKNFILWGDDGGTGTSTNIPSGFSERSKRVWKTAVTGTPGSVSFSVNLSTIGLVNTGNATDYALLIDTDTDFSSGASLNTSGATLVGNVLSFTGVNFADGNFFSIAAANVKQPGGVPGLVFWVRADKGVTGTTNVSNWADQSGYNDAFQATPANQPSLVTNDINSNPSVNFSGSTSVMSLTTPPADLNSTIFTVAVPTVNTNWRTMFRGVVNDHPLIIQNGGNTLGFYDNPGGGFKSSGFNWLQNETAVVGLEMFSGNVNFRKNGTQGASITTINLTGVNLDYFGNYQTGTQNFGRIAETLIYNTAAPLSNNQKNQIETYLAVKYGLTLTHDYLNSSGTTVWSATTNASYPNSITGIGRDDLSGLDQRQSKSVNTGSVLTIAKTTTGSPFVSDQSFLIAGDDAGSLGATTTGVPTGFPAYPMRVTRVWKAAVAGVPGTATVSFDLGTGIYNSGVAASYSLLISNTSDFSSATPVTGGSIVGSTISFSGVALSDGNFFTLGLPLVPSPGGVVNGLSVWLKSNTGVSSDAAGTIPATDLGAVQRWNDQTSLNNNAVNTGSPIFNLSNNLINFNPTVYYDGTSGHNLTYSVTNQYSLITVSKMDGTLNRRVFSSRIGNMLSGNWNGREDVLYLDGTPSILGGAAATNNPRLYSLTRSSSGAYQFFRNGLTLNTGAASFNSTVQLGIANGGAYPAESSKVYVTEVIQYDHDITLGELSRVHSYLGIKYGMTLDQTTPTNYVSSGGVVIWDATANAVYQNSITGIGRDDASGLDQRKSQSINLKSPAIVDKGGAFSTDKSFLVFGNDNSLLTPTTVGAHPSYPYRITRIWRAQVTGAPGAVSVSFDLSVGIYNSGTATDYALLIKNADTNFSAGATAYTTGASFNGSVLTFTGVTFNTGDYFTLALPNVPGPGGVVNNLQLWLKANQGVTGVATASQWNDQSGNGFNVSQGTTANQPAIQTSRVNFNPALLFNGSTSTLSLTGGFLGAFTYTNANVFVISRVNGISSSAVFYETNSGGQFDGLVPWGDNNVYWDAGNTGTNRLSTTWGGAVNTPFMWSMAASTTGLPSGALQEIYRNGQRIANDATMNSFTGNNSNLFIGSINGSNFFNGEVSEVAVYTGPLTTVQLQQIQTYLAIKYGVTISQTTPQNYLSSGGAIVFHATTTHAGYAKDVAGIARDDKAALDQRKSKSINSSPGDILSLANGDFTTPTAFSADGQYLVWGNNGLSLSSDITMVPYTQSGNSIVRQISRVWSTDKAGAQTGSAIVEVDMSLLYGPTGLGTNNTADVRLLLDNDATFGNSSAGEHAYTLSSSSGGKIYFTVPYADFTSGQGFLTIGSVNAATAPLFTPTPGGIAADVRLWLNANVGVTGGASASAWADQSPYGNSAVQATGAKQPTVLTNRVNFNTSLSFNGSNSEMNIATGILKNGTYTDVYVYGITSTKVIQSAKVFAETNLAGGQFGIYTPWSDNNAYWDAGDWGAANRLFVNWGGALNTPYLWSFGGSTTTTPSGVNQDIFRNGLRIANDNTMSSFTGNNANMSIGSQLGANFYNGEISELLMITSTITSAQQQRILSYFGLKYGVTLNQTTAQNYFASTNTVIFHATTTHSGYRNDIAGIGRDDNSTLSQLKSKTINTPADIVTFANGNFTSPTAFGGDQQFLMWGHNGLPYAADAATPVFTQNSIAIAKRLARVWSTDKNGSPSGNVVIEFNMGLIGGPSGAGSNTNADVRLLLDNDGTFGNNSAGEATQAPDAGFSATGGTIYFTVPYSNIMAGQGFVTIGSVNAVTCPLSATLPGGVAAPMKLWLNANVGVTGGTNASSWTDQSTNAFVANQATGANQPAIMSNRINFNTSLQFNGSSSNMSIAGGILGTSTYTDFTVFLISRTNTVSNSQTFQENDAGGQFASYTPWGDNNIYWDAGNSASNRVNTNWGGVVNTPFMWSLAASTTATASGALQDIYRNGLRIANDNTMNSFNGSGSNFFIGSGAGTNFYNGEVSEFIVYPSSLTSTQQQRIQSYLGIKYGVTLDQTTATNYVASDGTVLWNGTTNATYKSDIAGIGRDDASGLDQRKSQSVNTKSLVTIDNGGGAFANNMNFILWGSDNGATSMTTTGTYPGFQYRIVRTWKMAITGTANTVDISFDLSQGIYNSGNAANYQLLLKSGDINFSSGATGVAGTLVGNTLTFTGVTVADGEFFSLGLASFPAPGGVVPNMQFWVKGNTGVTGTTNVSLWADQSGANNNAFQATPAQQPALVSVDVNYNPSVNFSGGTMYMSLTAPPADLNSTIFAVGVPAVNSNWRTMFRGAINDHPIIIQSGGTTLGFYDGVSGGFKSGSFTWLQNEVAAVGLEMRTGNVNFRKNGTQGASITTINLAGLSLDYFGNYANNGQNFGRIAESVIYNNSAATLTATEKNRIESYLAVKYGLTLTHDYLASDASTIWSSSPATYQHDVAGVGRDDGSALNQKQSGSVNAGNILAISNGTGSLAVDNASNVNNFTADKSFFIWGHNNLALAGLNVTDFGPTTNGVAIKTRLARAWFSQETGTVGTVHLRFDLSSVKGPGGIPGTNDLSNVRLLVDADGVFMTGAFSVSPITFNNGTGIVEFEYDFIPANGFYFSIGSVDLASAPLPVELISFDALANDENVVVSWATASEINNDYFQVQSSIDVETWTDVAKVKGKGTTTERNTYQITDDSPFEGVSFYRLMQVDFDGNKKFSEVKEVDFNGSAIKLYPNPTVRKMVNLEMTMAGPTVMIRIYNLIGQEVYDKTLVGLEPRKTTTSLDLSSLTAGEYIVEIANGDVLAHRKLIVE